jgi:hypothetical protein
VASGLIGAAAILAAGSASAANLLVNGSFETGDFTGWFNTGNTGLTSVQGPGSVYAAQDGSHYVYFGAVGSDYGLNQTFSDTAGQSYIVSYWVAANEGGTSDVNAYINGTLLQSINPVPIQPYTEYSFSFVGTGSDTLTLGLRDDPSFDALDNVSVTATSAGVPEPAAWAMMISGLFGMGVALRSRKRAAAALA